MAVREDAENPRRLGGVVGAVDSLARRVNPERAIYGSIIVLAALQGLDEANASAERATVIVVFAVLAIFIGEVYAHTVGLQLQAKRLLSVRELLRETYRLVVMIIALVIPLAFLFLADVDLISVDLALDLASATLLAILAVIAWSAARLGGRGLWGSLFFAACLTALGLSVVLLKVIL